MLRGVAASGLAAALALVTASGALGNASSGAPSLTDLRVGVHPDHTRIVIETDAKSPYVIDPTEREVLVHVDAASTAEAVTTKSPHLVWVKVEPTALGTDVRIQLKQPVEVKTLVLANPDRIVLDLYPKEAAAPRTASRPAPEPAPERQPEPLPAPVMLPEEVAPPVVAEAPPEAEPGAEERTTPEEEPGLPAEDEGPLVLKLPEGEGTAPAPEAEPVPPPEPEASAPGAELAGEPTAPGVGGSPAAQSTEPRQSREPSAPAVPAAPGSRFGSPVALGATALVLLALFVWLRRRLRAGDTRISELPDDEPGLYEPPERAVAVGDESPTGESVFDVAPESVDAAPDEVPASLRPPAVAATGLDPDDETERRIAHLEKRIEELAEARDRLERQVAAQTEELRVQRAAIARTQRVLRSIAPRGEDEPPSEPLVRG